MLNLFPSNYLVYNAAIEMTQSEQELQAVKMLGLKLPTDPRWVNLAEMSLEDVLTDHAFCEQKAATSIISLIQGYPERADMVRELAPIVSEEWGHFRSVLREMDKRQLRMGMQRKDEYVNKLLAFRKKGGSKDEQLLEKLLICALIEARSCERFRLLSLHLQDEALREFYHRFMVSEAGHYKLFISLARQYFGEARTNARWEDYLTREAEIMQELAPRADRMH